MSLLPEPPVGLRHWRRSDAPALAAAWADAEIRRWNPVPDGLDAAHWIDGCAVRWERRLSLDLVIDEAGSVAGEVGLSSFTDQRAEIGFWVAADHRGAGRATTAVATVVTWARETLGLSQVWARTDPANVAAAGVLRGAGFRHLGHRDGSELWST